MFLCDFAKSVWQTTSVHYLLQCSADETTCEIFSRVFQRSTRDQNVEIAMVCWSLWNRRNNWVWNHANGSVFGVRNNASHLLIEWKEAQIKENDRRTRDEVGARVWKPPDAGWLKVNIDAAVFLNGNIGVGAVIRDENSCFVAARGKKIAGAWTAREAEAIGLKEALSWIIDKGYKQCVIETDSSALAAACNGGQGEAFFGTIVMNCIQLLKHVNQVLVVFIYRSANTVAHRLAKAAYSMSDEGEWYVTPPQFLDHVLSLDMI